MKCSSRRNCNAARQTTQMMMDRLNEVQLPKELQPATQEHSHAEVRPQ